MALAKCLLKFAQAGQNRVLWEELATSFYDEYRHRITINPTPQMAIPGRLTVLERIVKEEALGIINRTQAIEKVGLNGFNDVVPRFQTIGTDANIAKGAFYESHLLDVRSEGADHDNLSGDLVDDTMKKAEAAVPGVRTDERELRGRTKSGVRAALDSSYSSR